MAEGLLRKQLGEDVTVQSCGLSPVEPNQFMLTVMNEMGVDMSGHEPLSLEDVREIPYDRIIAFTASVQSAAQAAFEGKDMDIELWAVPDPGEGSLDVRALLNNFRAIRSNIAARIEREFRKPQ